MLLLTGRLPGEKKARAMPDSVGGSETMLGVGLAAVLLPSIVGGYLLHNAKWVLLVWREKPSSNNYFRILLLGWIWWLLWAVAASELAVAEKLQWLAIASSDKYPFVLEGLLATVAALVLRAVMDVLYLVLQKPEQQLIFAKKAAQYSEWDLKILRARQRSMEVFIWSSMDDTHLVMLTLENGEVYIGFASLMPTKNTPEWLELTPVVSGYRDEQDKTIQITTKYSDIERESELKETFASRSLTKTGFEKFKKMEMILPISRIVAFQRFDVNVHDPVQASNEKSADSVEAK